MDRHRLRRLLPPIVAILCFSLAISRPVQRGTWIVLGIVFLIVGLLWRKRDGAPPAA